jgi:4'-phosphopantetheinyl transferase
MPLVQIKQINPDRIIGIWHITEDVEKLMQSISLDQKQKDELSLFKVNTKKLEWLSARLLLNVVAAEMEIPFSTIEKDENGKPYIKGSEVELSLSHSYPYVAVIIDRKIDVGIDIEQPKEKLQVIASRFLCEKELAFIKNDVVKLCIAWCAKETLYKIYSKRGLVFKENLLLEDFDKNTTGIITGHINLNSSVKSYTLEYFVHEDYVITYNIS